MGALARIGAPAEPQAELPRPAHGLARAALLAALARGGAASPATTGGFARALELALRPSAPADGRLARGAWAAGLAGLAPGDASRLAPPGGAAGRASAGSAGAVPRVDQTDPREYDSVEQARVWGGSTCSAASLTAVLRGRGLAVTIADVMRAMPGALTPALGLVSRPGLVAAAHHFGLGARDDVTSYAALQQATAAGQSVLVDVTNARFPEGHWLVVTGADSHGLTIVDSSGYKLTALTREEFLAAWSGKGIRLTGGPGALPARPSGSGG